MRGFDRRIKEQMEECGYRVRSLVTHNVPGTGYVTKVSCKYSGSSGRIEIYLVDGEFADPLMAQEILSEHLRKIPKNVPRFKSFYERETDATA